jgi:hypothetical protein
MNQARSTHGAKMNAYRILVGKPEEKRPLGRTRRRWVDNIVTCQSIARQRLYKHPVIRVRNNRTNIYSVSLGNSQRANGLAR